MLDFVYKIEPSHLSLFLTVFILNMTAAGVVIKATYSLFKGYMTIHDAKIDKLEIQDNETRRKQIEVLMRLKSSEDCNKNLTDTVNEIKVDVKGIESKVSSLNGGVLRAIDNFRLALEKQMEINQNLLMSREKKE